MVAVVAVKITTATTPNAHITRVSAPSVAVLSTSQQNFKKVCKKEIKNTKIIRSVKINTPSTATSATKQPTSLDIPCFSAVAAPKNSATSTATTATKILSTHLYEGRKTA